MVSAQVPGILRFYKVDSSDSPTLLHVANIQSIGAGGSSEGAIANSPEKWQKLPYNSNGLTQNDRLRVTFEATTTATLDASDGAFICPITLLSGNVSYLRHPSDSAEWDIKQLGDTAFTGGVETPAFEMRVKRPFALGSNKEGAFISIENNA